MLGPRARAERKRVCARVLIPEAERRARSARGRAGTRIGWGDSREGETRVKTYFQSKQSSRAAGLSFKVRSAISKLSRRALEEISKVARNGASHAPPTNAL